MRAIDKLAWVHVVDGRILSVRSRGKDVFFVPGGKREAGETDQQALEREVREELSVVLDGPSIQPLGAFEAQAHGHPEGVVVRLTCYTGDYAGELRAAAEIEEIAWLSYADRDRVSLAGRMLFDSLHERGILP